MLESNVIRVRCEPSAEAGEQPELRARGTGKTLLKEEEEENSFCVLSPPACDPATHSYAQGPSWVQGQVQECL